MNMTKSLSWRLRKICRNAFSISEMNAMRLIWNRSNTSNKLSQSAGPGYKQSFNDGPVAFELAS